MSGLFNIPQRQSRIGILLLTLINFGKFLKAAWPMYVLFFIRGRAAEGYLLFGAGTAVVFVVMALVSWLQYRNFSYFVNAQTGELVINSGIINRKKVTIEKNKIQEVNINQPFIHKLLKIYKLEIDSPGSDKKEVTVNAISFENARNLKEYLMEDRTGEELDTVQSSEAKIESPTDRITISMGSLIKYGLTANYLKSFLALVGFSFYIGQNALEFLRGQSVEDYIVNRGNFGVDVEMLHQVPLLPFFILIFILFLLGILVNLVVNLFIYFGMKITKKEERLSLEYGLLNTKNAIISRNKVQMVTEIQNFFQKKVDVMQLRISQISGDENHKDSYNAIPGCSNKEKEDLLKFIWKRIPYFRSSLKPNIRRLMVSNLVFIIMPLIMVAISERFLRDYLMLFLLYAVVAEVMLILAFRNSRLFYNEDFISVQSGIWDVEKKTIETDKIQAVKMTQYFWQKKTDLGSVTFYTAGGKISFRSTSYRKLSALVNYSLFKVESSAKSWM